MAIDYDRLMRLSIPDREQSYSWKDSALYALGLGVGLDPMRQADLRFVYEAGMQALPAMAVVLAHPGFWVRDLDTGIDWVKVVHGEQGLTVHKPLQVEGRVAGQNRVTEVIDKGPGRGALIYTERTLHDLATGDLLATVRQVTFARGDGGFGGPPRNQPAPHAIPDRAPDIVSDIPTSPQGALIYRLSGDYNPLHADPAVAARAGFPKPILHGLATYGIAGRALVETVAGNDASRLASLDARFTAPVFPGETFRTEIWQDGAVISFRVRCLDRDILAINNGRAELRPELRPEPGAGA